LKKSNSNVERWKRHQTLSPAVRQISGRKFSQTCGSWVKGNGVRFSSPESTTSLIVTARVELVKVMPDGGPGGGGPGGGSKMIGEQSEIESVYSNALLEFRKKHG
jgi:hypothetical protein